MQKRKGLSKTDLLNIDIKRLQTACRMLQAQILGMQEVLDDTNPTYSFSWDLINESGMNKLLELERQENDSFLDGVSKPIE